MLAEGLVNHPAVGFGESGRKASEFRILLAKIEESEVTLWLGPTLRWFITLSIVTSSGIII